MYYEAALHTTIMETMIVETTRPRVVRVARPVCVCVAGDADALVRGFMAIIQFCKP